MTGLFRLSLAHTLQWEGGYVNDPNDPGGETNMGISRRAHPTEDIRGMTYERAAQIYFESYWLPSRAGDIEDWRLACKYFDLCVNMGTRRAAILLQRAVNRVAGPSTVAVDGVVGPKTLMAVNDAGEGILSALIEVAREFYQSLVQKRRSMGKFYNGWMNRLEDMP